MADDKRDKMDKLEDRDLVSPSPNLPVSPSANTPSQAHGRHHPPLYGIMAEFEGPNELVHAARRTYEAGYRRINGYSPYPIEELSEAVGFTHTSLPLIVFIGGLLGGIGGFLMQYWIEVIDYPINVGGKPYNSWPAFIPITFECTVLAAAFSAVLGMLVLNKLPQPYHPVFNAPNFALATRDRFFLVVEANDPKYDHDAVVEHLKSLNALEINDVEV
jgi:Alternative complex III, ActD subunit